MGSSLAGPGRWDKGHREVRFRAGKNDQTGWVGSCTLNPRGLSQGGLWNFSDPHPWIAVMEALVQRG